MATANTLVTMTVVAAFIIVGAALAWAEIQTRIFRKQDRRDANAGPRGPV